jgi:3',5'-cyclic AMP phosphodiesterase CpdA
VFGDRTTGTPAGLPILADAVTDANRLNPDFVMNIGDMVQGYNTTEKWLEQMCEYKAIMNRLECPWYPTPGNHDVYGGRFLEDLPRGQHEKDYEQHFGPLWYAFSHKNNWFIVLYTDEGNPETGEKSFTKPECQRMSDEQFDWLKSILKKASTADGIYVFQHHPRWLGGNYGDDWDKVHAAFVDTGNVKAVFAGHIHTMTFNEKDGIQYMTLATTGGKLDRNDPEAGMMHEIHHVSVRKNHLPQITVLPVKTTFDVTAMPSRRNNDIANPTQQAEIKTTGRNTEPVASHTGL